VAEEQEPFADVRTTPDGFSIPELKWRELLFVGAVRPEGDGFAVDPGRPMPPFRRPDLFPKGARFRIRRDGRRVVVLAAPAERV
jgi:hypothetical protein